MLLNSSHLQTGSAVGAFCQTIRAAAKSIFSARLRPEEQIADEIDQLKIVQRGGRGLFQEPDDRAFATLNADSSRGKFRVHVTFHDDGDDAHRACERHLFDLLQHFHLQNS